tara:strand:- start:530 stop:1000 length:471 start_codon:yes stop_codon:yes gene_type:complete
MPHYKRDNNKLQNPFNKEKRLLLKKLASYSKERDLLEGRDRKLLFQSGQYSEWFPNTAKRLPTILKELVDEIEDSSHEGIVTGMIEELSTLDPELMVLEKKYSDGTITDPELLLLAEGYEEKGNLKKALVIAEELYSEHPDNETVQSLLGRLRNNL